MGMAEKIYSNPLVIHISQLKTSKNSVEEIDQSDVFHSRLGRYSYNYKTKDLFNSDIVIVVDDQGGSKVFKNRHGLESISKKQKNDLEITIEGGVGSGKMVFATLFKSFLLTMGIKDVKVNNPHGFDDISFEQALKATDYIREKTGSVTITAKHKTEKLDFYNE